MPRNDIPAGEEGALIQSTRRRINHNFTDVCTSTADLAMTSTTAQAVIPGLVTDKLEPNATYHFEGWLKTTMTVNGGLNLQFNTPDTLTLSSILYETNELTASAVAVAEGSTATMGTSLVNNKTAAYVSVWLSGSFVTNAAGKFQLTAAQNTSHSDTTTIKKGSTLRLWAQINDTVV